MSQQPTHDSVLDGEPFRTGAVPTVEEVEAAKVKMWNEIRERHAVELGQLHQALNLFITGNLSGSTQDLTLVMDVPLYKTNKILFYEEMNVIDQELFERHQWHIDFHRVKQGTHPDVKGDAQIMFSLSRNKEKNGARSRFFGTPNIDAHENEEDTTCSIQ